MYRLDHLNGSQRGRPRIIHRRRVEAGADLSCQIWAREGLAPRHAEFEDDGTRVRVRALSDAPVRVNGRDVREAELKEGDTIEIGALAFRFSRRRFRGRDLLRFLPALLLPAALIAFLVIWGLRWRAERKARSAVVPAWVPRPQERTDPALRAMEDVEARLREGKDAERLERIRQELEEERRRAAEEPPVPAAADPTPSLSPAATLAQRARMLEKERRFEEARRIWETILEMGPAEELYTIAAGEIFRLGRIATDSRGIPVVTARPTGRSPPAEAKSSAEPRLRILSVDHRRFPGTAEYEEMRLLRIVVGAEGALPIGAMTDAYVAVTFYDAPIGDTAAVPSRVTAPQTVPLTRVPRDADGRWNVTVAYVVPRGFRERERRAAGRLYQYHGFVAQVIRGGRPDDAEARPPELAERRS